MMPGVARTLPDTLRTTACKPLKSHGGHFVTQSSRTLLKLDAILAIGARLIHLFSMDCQQRTLCPDSPDGLSGTRAADTRGYIYTPCPPGGPSSTSQEETVCKLPMRSGLEAH